jgi:hypothetical protein
MSGTESQHTELDAYLVTHMISHHATNWAENNVLRILVA